MEVIPLPQVDKYIIQSEINTQARIYKALVSLEKYGKYLGMPVSKKISSNLYELRIVAKVQIRIIYCFHGEYAYLLNIFIKKLLKIPKQELTTAKLRYKRLTQNKL